MRTVVLAQLRTHAARLIASTLAVVIAVGFVVATLVLNETVRSTVSTAVGARYVDTAAVVTSEDARAYKPRPEPFELAMTALGVTAGDVLHVGDSLTTDIAGAEALGIASAWINRSGRPLPEGPAPTRTVSALTDLLPMLQG